MCYLESIASRIQARKHVILAASDHLHEDFQSVKETQPSKMMDREADGR